MATAVGATPVYAIGLDTIEGVVTGDVLHLIQGINTSATYTVLNVNPETKELLVKEPVTNLSVGNRLYFDAETQAEVIFTDARTILAQAAQPFVVDLSRCVQATTQAPTFGYQNLYQYGTSADLRAISDVQPATSTTVSVISGTAAMWSGSPDNWSPATLSLKSDWTGQLTSAPSSLMPYESRTLAPFSRLRNRAYHEFTYRSVDNGPAIGSWSPAVGNGIPVSIFVDYIGMRKLTLSGSGTVITANAWSGSAWGGNTGITWPSASVLYQIINFPTGPTSTSLLAYTSAETIELGFYGSAGVKSVAVPAALKGAQLVPTEFGPYLVGATGYAQITYSGGVLSLTTAVLPDQVTYLWPNTFAARTSGEMVVLGRSDLQDSSSGDVSSETWLFRLTALPNSTNPIASIILSEKIQDGSPVFAGAQQDPSKAGRIIGHLGGLPWTLDNLVPWTIPRFTPMSMSAADAIEHICQLQSAMAIPMPSGVLAIVSRTNSESVLGLQGVKVISANNYLSWPNFYSQVLVETQDGSYYAETDGQLGGTNLTITGQPMIHGLSQAQATADALSSWYGRPRSMSEQVWFWPDPTTASPWETLAPFTLLTVNGSVAYRLMAMDTDFISGETKVTLIAN